MSVLSSDYPSCYWLSPVSQLRHRREQTKLSVVSIVVAAQVLVLSRRRRGLTELPLAYKCEQMPVLGGFLAERTQRLRSKSDICLRLSRVVHSGSRTCAQRPFQKYHQGIRDQEATDQRAQSNKDEHGDLVTGVQRRGSRGEAGSRLLPVRHLRPPALLV